MLIDVNWCCLYVDVSCYLSSKSPNIKDSDKQNLLDGASAIRSSAVRTHEAARASPNNTLLSIAEAEEEYEGGQSG